MLLLLLACGAPTDSGTCGREPPLSYDNFGKGLMGRHCAGCHSSLLPEGQRNLAPLGVDLDTWAGVVQWGTRIEARSIGEAPTMPPGGGPTDQEKAMLTEWLQCDVLPAGENP